MTFTVYDEFAGFGGSSQGLREVPGLEVVLAANHAKVAVEVHADNFPDARHECGDITKADLTKFPRADFFWASPACPPWSNARGKRRDFDRSTQNLLFDYLTPEQLTEAEELGKRRALMEEVPRYLRAMALRGAPVLGGVVENVVEVRKWDQFGRWRREIETAAPAGYKTWVIALNSMHAPGINTLAAAQSRNRAYVAFLLNTIGREPDWNKWLRPRAHCPSCDQMVNAMQSFKKPGADMGVYGIKNGQYVYRCPKVSCRGRIVEPEFAPALTALDLSDPGIRIGDRPESDPLADKTRARIRAGIAKFARPVTVEVSGHTYDSLDLKHPQYGLPGGYVRAWPVDQPLTTQSTSETKGVALPPLLVPSGGTWRNDALPSTEPMPTRTATESDGVLVAPFVMRNFSSKGDPSHLSTGLDQAIGTLTTAGHQSLIVPPFLTIHRDFNGGHQHRVRPLSRPLPTLAASGNHHGVLTPPRWAALYAYDTGHLRSLGQPMPTQTAIDGDSLLVGEADLPDVDDCFFRMLHTREIQAAMAFFPCYSIDAAKTKKAKTRGLGNAVTPNVAERLGCALVEAFTGEAIAQ